MTTYSSIRIYISSSASILPNGFYNVVGYYGPSISDSTNPYHIDVALGNFPIVKANGFYYFLTYNEGDGFRPNMVDMANPDNMFIPEVDSKPIYLEQRDDAHMISNYDTPLGANFVIDNIERLYTAYRRVTVDVYDNYAVEHYYEIYDSNHIIDTIEADFVLAATNPDGVEIVPREGNVEKLFTFNLTYQKNLDEADVSRLRKIALYDYNTREVVTTVDINTVSYTLGGNTLQFSLRFEVNSPSTYFLYIPSGTFIYEDHISSGMTMFAYSIRGSQGGGSVFEFIYSPTVTRKLQDVKLTFINVMNIPATRLAGSISIEGPNGTESFVCTEDEDEADGKVLFTHSGNEVFLTFPEAYENYTNETATYVITIPANKISVQQDVWVENALVLYIDVVGEAGSLPTGTDEYSIEVTPQPGVVYGVSYINIAIKLAVDLSGVVELNEGRTLNEITVAELGNLTNVVDSVANASIKPAYLDENGKQTYEFTCRFSRRNDSLPSYEVTIPSELFAITIYNGDDTQTLYNQPYGLIYTIRPQPSVDEGDTPGSVSFDYKLLTFKAENDVPGNDIAFRPGTSDTIIVNRKYLQRILAKPCLTVTYLDHANGEAVIGKEILAILPGDTISVNIRATYYNNDNVEVSTTSSVEYGYLADTVSSVDLSSVFPMFRTSYPSYFRLNFIFNYNQTEITREIEIQVVPDFIYNKVRENINWNRTLRFDLYTGSQTDKQWGCMYLTNQYDCVLNYKVPGANEGDPEITKYIAELVPTTKVRTGNLSGIYNDTFGTNQPQGYGLYGENVYLTGNFYLNNGKSLVDISDDILMAVGNIREAQDRLNNLDTSVKATIEALTLRQESFENGLDANIKNYISTNKNAVLKIGLDYSLWSLGSAGIAMVNPNATYKFDPISGNYTVDEETVGDGDEYITLQGSKIKFSTYNKKNYSDVEYTEIIYSPTRPEAWEYNGSIYVPYDANGHLVKFYRGYVAEIPRYVDSVPVTETTTEFLKFAAFKIADITTATTYFEATSDTTDTSTEDTLEFYSFSNYYTGTAEQLYVVRLDENQNETLVSLDSLSQDGNFYYIPRVTFAGMFKDGKFNSDYIEAKNIVAVDVSATEDTDEPELDEFGEPKYDSLTGEPIMQKRQKYKKNPKFDPTLPITEDNYPVLNYLTSQPDKTANFAVVSGTTGKITAKGASITGTIIVGDENAEHIKITDNKGDDAEEIGASAGPALYIKKNKDEIVAQFGTTVNNNPISALLGSKDLRDGHITSTPTRTIVATPEPDVMYTRVNEEYDPEYPSEPVYEATVYYSQDYQQSTYNNDATIVFQSGEFILQPGERKNLRFTSGKIKFIVTQDNYGYYINRYYTQNAQICVFDGTDYISLTNAYASIKSGEVEYTLDTSKKYLISNNTDAEKQYQLVLRLYCSISGYYTTTVTETQMEHDSVLVNAPASISYTAKISLSENINCVLGDVGYMTRILGNGLVVGYDSNNYFTTYFISPSENTNKMILDFQSEGYGMKFDGGNIYNTVRGQQIKAFIPILQGRIDIKTISKDGQVYAYYKFYGVSIVGGSAVTGNDINSNVPVMSYCPRFGDVVKEKTGWWIFGHTTYVEGKPYNMGVSGGESDSSLYVLNYCVAHDLCIVRGTAGQVILYFGPKWETALGVTQFMSDSKIFVTATGIGRDEPQNSGFAAPGCIYASVKAIRSWPEHANTSCTIYKVSDTNTPWSPHSNLSTQPQIKNMLQIALADDSSLNDGSFYISVAFCPNG